MRQCKDCKWDGVGLETKNFQRSILGCFMCSVCGGPSQLWNYQRKWWRFGAPKVLLITLALILGGCEKEPENVIRLEDSNDWLIHDNVIREYDPNAGYTNKIYGKSFHIVGNIEDSQPMWGRDLRGIYIEKTFKCVFHACDYELLCVSEGRHLYWWCTICGNLRINRFIYDAKKKATAWKYPAYKKGEGTKSGHYKPPHYANNIIYITDPNDNDSNEMKQKGERK